MNLLLETAALLKEPVNQTISQAVNKVGLTSIVTGGSIKAAEVAEIIEKGNGITDWLAVIALIGGVLLIVQKIVDTVCTIVLTQHKMRKEDGKL